MNVRAATRVAGVVLALAALGSTTTLGKAADKTPKPPDRAAAKVLAAVKDHLGDKYAFGAAGPKRWDCSGLSSRLWRTIGGAHTIPRTSRDQQAWAWPIAAKDAFPGDLVFFGDPVTHVGIYQGNGRILDASSSKGAVVQRPIWTSDTVRYGRVPRPGVPHPPAPKAPAKAKAKAPPPPTRQPATKPTPTPVKAKPAPAFRPIPPLGHHPHTKTSKEMAAFVAAVKTRIGARWASGGRGPAYDAAGLVDWAWARAGFGALPSTPAAIERRTRPVALKDLRVGDLIFWGGPAVHVAVYVGNGEMIDASRVLRVVSRRRVFASETVRFARLTPISRR